MKYDKKILICYNEPTRYYNNYLGKDDIEYDQQNDLSEREFLKQIDNIRSILLKRFTYVETLAVNRNIKNAINQLINFNPDAIFNFVESIEGNTNLEVYFAGLYDLLGFEYTGNTPITLGNCLVKSRTKQILESFRIKTPKHFTCELNYIPSRSELKLKFPLILKLLREDASIGISEFSVVRTYKQLVERLKYLYNSFNQEVLIEEYIDGRELNVAILGNKILPISEISFDTLPENLPKIITYEAKWSEESVYFKNTIPKCPTNLDAKVEEKVREVALKAYEALECRDYARVDIRLNKKNIPYVIEVNPNPDISPDTGFVRSAKAANINYEQLLYTIISFAIERSNYDTQAAI
ncbi:D-alanine--D-alanine ligase family protein [Stygiobacter electus]|uniref:ATP-grasp domain-containing protein n=1 Tax=Stygiobacter electus TaxID=3032292 RepID=A0AAE3NY78_9BACT|nr:ATP-grasp domain-containing protein [Stygiobacter electus]MDF1610774.1 ATP-grasp domain-containing protein [Stygiobacter electus]